MPIFFFFYVDDKYLRFELFVGWYNMYNSQWSIVFPKKQLRRDLALDDPATGYSDTPWSPRIGIAISKVAIENPRGRRGGFEQL